MLLFLILLLPLFLAAYCFKVRTVKIVPVIVIGAMSAVLVVAFKILFVMSHRIIPYSFAENFVYYLLKETLVPSFVLYAIYFLISKDSKELKINTYLPLELAFYSVFLPYCVISSTSSTYNWFSICVKPVIYAIMIAQTGVSLRDIYRGVCEKNKKKVFVNIILFLAFLILPAVIEAFYITDFSLFVIIGATVVYLVLPVFLFIFSKKDKAKQILVNMVNL